MPSLMGLVVILFAVGTLAVILSTDQLTNNFDSLLKIQLVIQLHNVEIVIDWACMYSLFSLKYWRKIWKNGVQTLQSSSRLFISWHRFSTLWKIRFLPHFKEDKQSCRKPFSSFHYYLKQRRLVDNKFRIDKENNKKVNQSRNARFNQNKNKKVE